MKPIALLSLLILVVAAGLSCSSPARPFPGSPAPGEPGADPPGDLGEIRRTVHEHMARGDLARADALVAAALAGDRSREEKKEVRALRRAVREAQFRDACPIVLEVWSPRDRYGAGETIDVEFRLYNRSPRPLLVPSAGWWSWLPFSESRRSFLHARIETSDVSAANGFVSGSSWNEFLEIDGSIVIEPGAYHAMPLSLAPAATGEILYRRLFVGGELMPGGLEVGEFDYGLIRLEIPEKVIHVLPEREVFPPTSLADLDASLAAGEALPLFKAAVSVDVTLLPDAVDALVASLPTLPAHCQRFAMAALGVMTRERLGLDRNRWIDWWRSERLARSISGDRPGDRPDDTAVDEPVDTPDAVEYDRETESEPESEIDREHDGEPSPATGEGAFLPAGRPGPSVVFAVAFSGVLETPVSCLPEEADKSITEESEESEAIREGLGDRYYGRRHAAVHELVYGAEESLPRIARLIRDPDPLVRRGCAEALASIGGDEAARILTAACSAEKDIAVRQAIAQALGILAVPFPVEAGPGGGPSVIEAELHADRRLMVAMEEVMHEGTIPGFYDGQFSSFWEIGPDVPARLLRVAHDPDYQHVVRVLAVMSLSEQRGPSLESDLKPLILPPREELMREWLNYKDLRLADSITETMIEEGRELKLSGYARYSLAKAGIDHFVIAKITEMKRWIEQEKVRIDEQGTFKSLFGARLILKQEFSRNLFFDVGYEYHQLDAFEDAEKWYRRLIRRFPDSFSVSNAHYNLACIYSLQGRCEESLEQLSHCVEEGFLDFSWMEKDRDLENVRMLPGFEILKQKVIEGETEETGGGEEVDNPEE